MDEKFTNNFKHKIIYWLTVVSLVLLIPFFINNFLHHRYLLAAGCFAVVSILATNCWYLSRGRYSSLLYSIGLVPAIIFLLVLALRQQEIIGILWCYPSVLAFYLILPERKAWIANVVLFVIILPLALYIFETLLVARIAVTLLMVNIFSAIFIRMISEQQNKLEVMATTDPLTGLFNRMLLHDTLEQAIQQNNRTGEPMTLISIDLDHFKVVNDKLGHDAGDMVLQGVANLFHKRFRRVDRVFRLGGEEFLVILHSTDAENGNRIAEELRALVASQSFLPDHPITVSIGVATCVFHLGARMGRRASVNQPSRGSERQWCTF
ncbi:MAG: GGDEF domain-containing protein [Proteobacteria bacterium]|nr:GGDEF domain-containing protein [Pseudomonadota bacterium]